MSISFQGIQISGGLKMQAAAGSAPVVSDPYWSNVSLLTNTTSTNNQTNNTFLDSSTNNFTITRNGTPTQGSFTPFTVASNTSYSTSTNGGSGYFNGSSSLSTPSNTAFAFGTGDFTIEGWVYLNSFTDGKVILTQGWPTISGPFLIYQNATSNRISLYSSSNGSSWDIASDVAIINNPQINQWYYLTITRSGNTFRLFANGQLTTTFTSSASLFNASQSVTIGGGASGATFINGYIQDLRLSKGVARYTSNFTPPTTPLTAISGTSLLLNYTNAGIYDATTKNNLTGIGTVQASTTQTKWSPTSLKLAGGTDALTMPSSSNFDFGSGDFTIEAWIYIPSYVSSSAIISKGANGPFLIFIGASNEIAFYSSTNGSGWAVADLRFATAPATNTWHYIAVTRSGSTVRTFFNGTLANSATLTGSVFSNSTDVSIGRYTSSVNGYIQDLRVTKGVARYTSTFTPPTAAFPTK